MSFKIFKLQLLGKIKPIEKIESTRLSLKTDYDEYTQVKHSEDLKLFLELEQTINSESFKAKKAELQALQFKNSKEYNLLKEYEGLAKKKSIRNYLQIKNSAELSRYESIRDSEKLKEYEILEEYVKEGAFNKDKNEILNQKYKDSVENKHLKDLQKLEKKPGIKAYLSLSQTKKIEAHENTGRSEIIKRYLELKNLPDKNKQQQIDFETLSHDPNIKDYFRFEKSEELKLYRETARSHDLKRYNELKSFVDNDAFRERVKFLKDNKKFKKSEPYRKLTRYKELRNDADIKFFFGFERSKLYKNYLDVRDSFELKRYYELEEITSSATFKERKVFLEDNQKWEKTEEFVKENKYNELKSNPLLVKYFKYKDTNAFRFFNDWELSFEERFSSSKIDESRWSLMPVWANKLLGKNYSLPGDLHAFTEGDNIQTGSRLILETRQEKADGLVWKLPAGFIPHEFEYTSGIISSIRSFNQPYVIFETKIKFNPVKEVVSSCVLQGEGRSEKIYLLEMGARNRLGFGHISKEGKLEMEGLDISNLKNDKWYIFTIEKRDEKYCWKINDTIVLESEHRNMNFPLHISFFSLVLQSVSSSSLPVKFQVEWVKCYKLRAS